MGLALEILGLIVLLGVHVFVTMRDRRAALVSRIGEWPYRGLFSLASIVGILLIAYGFAAYRAAGMITVWNPTSWTRHIVELLMWPASIMVAAAYIPGNIKRVLKLYSAQAICEARARASMPRPQLRRRRIPSR